MSISPPPTAPSLQRDATFSPESTAQSPEIRVIKHNEVMTAQVLGAIFAPLLVGSRMCWADMAPEEMLAKSKDCAWVCQCLIEHWTIICECIRVIVVEREVAGKQLREGWRNMANEDERER
jgi:hypothetical protein